MTQIPIEDTPGEQKDVTIHLNPLSLIPERPGTQSQILGEVQKIFDSEIEKEVEVILLNRNNAECANFKCKIKDIRANSMKAAIAYNENVKDAVPEDFIIITIFDHSFHTSFLVEEANTEQHG